MNGGLCVPTGMTAYTCKCDVGYSGSRCEKADTAAARCDFSNGFCVFTSEQISTNRAQIKMQRMIASNKYHEVCIKLIENSSNIFSYII